jgi:hypothetical protein
MAGKVKGKSRSKGIFRKQLFILCMFFSLGMMESQKSQNKKSPRRGEGSERAFLTDPGVDFFGDHQGECFQY